MTPALFPKRLELDHPTAALRWLSSSQDQIDLGAVDVAEMWGLTAVATLGRRERPSAVRVSGDSGSPTVRFAGAVGFWDAIQGRPAKPAAEQERTFPLTRIHGAVATEPIAREISNRIILGDEYEDARRTTYYVLNELLRNVLQHSKDPLGGIVAAQRNDGGRNWGRPFVQVAVGDAGIGIQQSLLPLHPKLTDPRQALVKALEPHISGTFVEGESGSLYNAGVGLFFISEMTKLIGGRLMIATRGATLMLEGRPGAEEGESHHLHFLEPGLGFPGTLVAFEMPEEEQAYDGMMQTIRDRAKDWTPKRQVHKWLRFEEPPADIGDRRLVVNAIKEDIQRAGEWASTISQRLTAKEPVAIDFVGVSVCTQSFLHALLYEPLRLAWALKVPIYAVRAAPAVQSLLELLENYALGG